MHFGVLSHTIGAIVFLILFLLLLTSWRGRSKGVLLVTAIFISLLWALLTLYYINTELTVVKILYTFFELARILIWIILFFELLKPLLIHTDSSRKPHIFYLGLGILSSLLLATELVPLLSFDFSLRIQVVMLGHILLALIGLVLTEQLFRNTRPESRWATKYLYFAVGTLFAYDFFLYTDALLLQRIDVQIWSARGIINALTVPFIAVAIARNPRWSLDIFVSRRIVLHSVAIIGAGLYLLTMAAAGYYIRYFGGNWGHAVQAIFFVATGLLLATMLFSGHIRSIVIVFFSKHFFNYKYDYRDEWLRFSDTMSSSHAASAPRERAIRAIAEILHSPGGWLWTRGSKDHFYLSANFNVGEPETYQVANNSPLIRFLETQQWVIDINEYQEQPESYRDLQLPQWLQQLSEAWLIIPLLQADELQGFVVLAKSRALRTLNWEDRDLVKTAGKHVASYVALLDTTDALMDARQFEAFNRLSAYVVHDLKNVAAQLSLVVRNAERHKDNPIFIQDAIATVANATGRMSRMLAQLRKDDPNHSGQARTFALADALQQIVTEHAQVKPVPNLILPAIPLHLHANRDRFIAIIGHLIQNAQEASQPDDAITITMIAIDKTWVSIEITDTGSGMEQRFVREKLFQPFNTTKGNAGMGIGVYESREFVHSLDGEISVNSRPGVGTTFVIKLPIADDS